MALEILATLSGHTDTVWAVTWSPTIKSLAAASSDKSIRIYDKSLKESIIVIDNAHNRTIRSVAYAPNGRLLASGSFDGQTLIWDISQADPECVASLEGHENEVKSVAWSASGSLLATCGRDKSVWIWELVDESDFECASVLQEHTQDVKFVTWHPYEDVLASASYDDTIKIWRDDDDDWSCSDTLKGHTSTVWALDFNQNGDKLVSVSDDRSIRLWVCSQDGVWTQSHVIPDHHSRPIYAVSWSKNHNYIATSGGDSTIKILKEEDNELVQVCEFALPEGENEINTLQWCPLQDDAFLLASGGDDSLVRIWKFNPEE